MHTLSLTFPIAVKNSLIRNKNLMKFFWVFVVLSVIFLSVLYIFQINTEISEKYSAVAYEKELINLMREKESLEIGAINLASLNNVVSLLESSGKEFVKAESIHHLKISKNRVVLDR